jgi:hypothetical protein
VAAQTGATAQLDESLAAVDLELTAGQRTQLDRAGQDPQE